MNDYIDPPNMPEDERMTDAEFKVVREHLGLSGDWLATHLNVNPRTVRSWEQGRYPIPDGVRLAIEAIEEQTATFVDSIVTKLLDSNETNLTIVTYRSDAEYHTAHPDIPFPASWHRAVVARIVQSVPAVRIEFASAMESAAQR